MDFIKDLDKNDLDMIDIKKRGHQKKLLLAVQQLNDMELTDILDQAVLGMYRDSFLLYFGYFLCMKKRDYIWRRNQIEKKVNRNFCFC